MPVLSLNQQITTVAGIKALSPDRPVFLLLAEDDSHIVVKQETAHFDHDKTHLKFNLKTMKTVSPNAGGKVLGQAEVDVIRNFAETSRFIADVMNTQVSEDVRKLEAYLENYASMWFKMQKAEGIMSLENAVLALRNNQDKTGIRTIANSLNAPGGLETLGKIAAIDLYNSNSDRFSPQSDNSAAATNERTGVRFRVIVNTGNVLLSVQQGALTPIGLDSYEALSAFRNVNTAIEDLEQQYDQLWSGRYLAPVNEHLLKQFAKDIVHDLEDALGPRNRKVIFAKKKRLADNAARRVKAGMDEARQLVINKLRMQTNKPNAPAGLTSRLDILMGN